MQIGGIAPVVSTEVRTHEAGAGENSFVEMNAVQYGAVQPRAAQVGATQIRVVKMRVTEVLSGQVGTREAQLAQIGPAQFRGIDAFQDLTRFTVFDFDHFAFPEFL